MNREITLESLKQYKEKYLKDPVATAARHALNKSELLDLVHVQEYVPHMFSIDIKTLPATNQGASGRCWIYSGLNVLREEVAKKCNLEDFEISQNYVAFYDKLEKINFFMETVIELKEEDFDDRTLSFILQGGINDGGQWDMLTAIIEKYGVVPASVMPDAYMSSHTRSFTSYTNRRLRIFARDVKANKDNPDKIAQLKEQALEEFYRLCCSCFGVPVEKFDFEYVDKEGNYHCDEGLDPHSFYDKYVGLDLNEYVSIIHSPTVDKPYYQRYTVKHLGNVTDKPIKHLNVPMEDFKEAVLKQLKDNKVVWFGADVGKYADRKRGLWDTNDLDLESLLQMDFTMDKENALYTHESSMNHAMVITGVNLVNDKPNRWKIENSWGKDSGNKGYYVCSDDWFDLFVYQAVVHKNYLNEKALKALDTELHELAPWDPMGTLAE
ncbi:MAG: C1 family peptidase [Erysipelotrichaceae bacterium]|nr:C1 family peptidase [Erysipelotrichaceae bacterium]